MPDFSRAKIYKITGGGMTYFGSTTLKYLCQRIAGHKQDKLLKYKGNCTSFQILDFPDCQISLVENWPCANKDELRARERFWIENNDCVNKRTPGRTKQEWLAANPNYKRNWDLQNKAKVAAYQRNYYQQRKNKIQVEIANLSTVIISSS